MKTNSFHTSNKRLNVALHEIILVPIYAVVNSHGVMLTFADTEVTIGMESPMQKTIAK